MKHKILLSILTLSISFPVFAEYKIMLNSEKIKIPEPTIPSLELNHTFTNCGKTGRFGPNENQCINEYNGQNILKEAFNFYVDNGYQIFTVNKNGIYNITAIGAQGGNGGTDSKIIRGGGYSGGVGANRPDETYQGVSAKSFNNGNNKVSSVYNSGGHGKVIIEYIQ